MVLNLENLEKYNTSASKGTYQMLTSCVHKVLDEKSNGTMTGGELAGSGFFIALATLKKYEVIQD